MPEAKNVPLPRVDLTPEQEKNCLTAADEIVKPFGLRSEFLGEAMVTGVRGDGRAYTRVINLTGPFPGHEILAKVSTEITNTRDEVCKVTFEITPQTESTQS